jgi:hypothetical protein
MKHYLFAGLLLAAIPTLAQTTPAAGTPPSLLASAVVAGLVSAIVSGLIAWLVKDKEYKNDYYKKVIDKRIKAIEALETYVSLFNTAQEVIDISNNQHRQLHTFFANKRDDEITHKAIEDITKSGIWYGVETSKKANKLSRIVGREATKCSGKNSIEIIRISIDAFREIEIAKIEVQRSMRNDMASLHKVEAFFKAKALAAQDETADEIVDADFNDV